ncbi:AMP-binding protein [Lamprobacter modestohalophilus]|uniref:AMP-binding protein n=1 Tax=Lamprobacter modestohalophilus TaxID=1064514 RepID=UPI002ADEF21F|nr:AMP-binding protein [Lamprobacter modestohalophilus]MEA1051473.1 AMP-binding protein [Lamprobacter modestohalophilus]
MGTDQGEDLSTLLERRRALGDAGALRFGDQRYSYAELAVLVEQRAAALAGAGVAARELVLCPTTPVLDSVLMQWALARLGVVMLPVRADLPASRRASLIRTTGAEWSWRPADEDVGLADVGLADVRLASLIGAGADTAERVTRITDAERRAAGTLIRCGSAHWSPPAPASEPAPAARPTLAARPALAAAHPNSSASLTTVVPGAATAPALFVETSGSSAEPKIVMLSAAAIIASCLAVNARLELKRGDRWLCVLPRQHVGGLAIGYRCAFAGAELIVQSRFEAEKVQVALWDQRITHLSLVPAMLQRLLAVDPTPPPDLRVALLGGQGIDSNLARRAVEQGWPLYLGYGMTETFSQIAGGWIDAEGLPQRGMIPLDGVELSCPSCGEANTKSRGVSLANIQPPEQPTRQPAQQTRSRASAKAQGNAQQAQPLRIRGPMLMLGYANPTRTPGHGLDNGWLQTSDLACRLPSGSLQVLGRADDVVLIAGINVLPAEIERELAQLDQIAEIAVIGVPDPTWGHRLVALYVGKLEPAQLEAWCRNNLPSHQRPRSFARLERLPTLSAGKRDRRALFAHAEALAPRAGLEARVDHAQMPEAERR